MSPEAGKTGSNSDRIKPAPSHRSPPSCLLSAAAKLRSGAKKTTFFSRWAMSSGLASGRTYQSPNGRPHLGAGYGPILVVVHALPTKVPGEQENQSIGPELCAAKQTSALPEPTTKDGERPIWLASHTVARHTPPTKCRPVFPWSLSG